MQTECQYHLESGERPEEVLMCSCPGTLGAAILLMIEEGEATGPAAVQEAWTIVRELEAMLEGLEK